MMLEDGEITREQMRQRLGEMRRRMGEQKAEADNPFAAYEAMKKRLDMAVQKGDLTREEADEKLVEFRKSLGR